MAENLDALLKTENSSAHEVQEKEDPLKYSKRKIKSICRALCLPAKDYSPAKTIDSIKHYLAERSTKDRILYSEISSFVYALGEKEQGNFTTNMDCLINFALDETNAVDDLCCKLVVKIYDHYQLAISQKSLATDPEKHIKAMLVAGMDDAQKQIEEDLTEKLTERLSKLKEELTIDTKEIEKQYITILGIFASVVLSFVGGITFSSSVLQNIHTVSIYRLLFVIDLLAIVLVNAIYILVRFICQINDKQISLFEIKRFNTIVVGFGLGVIFAWLIDAQAFAEFINQWLPWAR